MSLGAVEKLDQSQKPRRQRQLARVAGAFFPDVVREAMRDEIAEPAMTEEDVRELYKRLKQQMDGGSHTKH